MCVLLQLEKNVYFNCLLNFLSIHSFIHPPFVLCQETQHSEGFHWDLTIREREYEGHVSRSKLSGEFPSCELLGFLLPKASLNTCLLSCPSAPSQARLASKWQVSDQVWTHFHLGQPDPSGSWSSGRSAAHWKMFWMNWFKPKSSRLSRVSLSTHTDRR